jgi:hypothetical protein
MLSVLVAEAVVATLELALPAAAEAVVVVVDIHRSSLPFRRRHHIPMRSDQAGQAHLTVVAQHLQLVQLRLQAVAATLDLVLAQDQRDGQGVVVAPGLVEI